MPDDLLDTAPVVDRLLEALEGVLLFWPHTVADSAVHRLVEKLRRAGIDDDSMVDRLRRGDPSLIDAVVDAVCIGETYFGRHSEQLFRLADLAASHTSRSRRRECRAWSAGCATGEETYSLAAVLLDAFAGATAPTLQVLGTDVSRTRIRHAMQNIYSQPSVRSSEPYVESFLEVLDDGSYRVRASVADVTQFRVHNLLLGPPIIGEQFDVIVCRNVLIYFSETVARQVFDTLLRSLRPGGFIAFGTLDTAICPPPPPLQPCAAADLQIYRRTTEPVTDDASMRGSGSEPAVARPQASPKTVQELPSLQTPRPESTVGEPTSQAKVASAAAATLALHRRALKHIEDDKRHDALELLHEIAKIDPEYVPAHLERALLLQRMHREAESDAVLQDLLHRLDGYDSDAQVPGPVDLPISFYRIAATRALQRKR